MQVAAWLRGINLGQYAAFVVENEVDGYTLLDLVKVTRPQLTVELWLAFVPPASFLRPGPRQQTGGLESLGVASKLHQSQLRGGLSRCRGARASVTIGRFRHWSLSTFKELVAPTDRFPTAQAPA